MTQGNSCGRVFSLSGAFLLLARLNQFEAFPESYSKTIALDTITYTKTGILDGAELQALTSQIASENRSGSDIQQLQNEAKFRKLNFLAGQASIDGTDRRVVGVESSDIGDVILSSMAFIPEGVSDADAVSTAWGSLVGVHCCIPKVNRVGGSSSEDGSDFVAGKTVVLGGGAYAKFCANALENLGADVTLVTTGRPRIKNGRVNIMQPMDGESEVGFASALGQFDTLLDTLYDENNVGTGRSQMGSGVVEQLRRLHNCKRYVSTYSNAQSIISEAGVIWGPGKAKDYIQEIKSSSSQNRASKCIDLQIPDNFGQSTLQMLLNKGIIFPAGRTGNEPIVRGWTLEDFFEYTYWPRDSTGSVSSRYGLPVIDDIESMSEEEAEERQLPEAIEVSTTNQNSKNPFVTDIEGVQGLQTHIVSSKLDCVLFLSAPFCRTCKNLSPQYTRMARLAKEEHKDALLFAKADAMGKVGKDLGKYIGVNSVPTFLLFREGERFGSPLSISKLPSKKLDLAVEYLMSGMEWDVATFRDA